MHFTILSGHASVAVEHHCRIVVQTRSSLLEKRSDENDFVHSRQLGVKAGGRAGDGFGKVEQVGIFRLAEI